ncbi:MAG TPA: hypothetical protein VK968_12565, partial [Roseimicrobium sp.]|nr:hypothetical protein [Roseimicrobium sp.]
MQHSAYFNLLLQGQRDSSRSLGFHSGSPFICAQYPDKAAKMNQNLLMWKFEIGVERVKGIEP